MPIPPWLIVLFVAVNIVWMLSIITLAYIKRMRNHPFPDRNGVEVVYRERRASGNSDRDWFTRIGESSSV